MRGRGGRGGGDRGGRGRGGRGRGGGEGDGGPPRSNKRDPVDKSTGHRFMDSRYFSADKQAAFRHKARNEVLRHDLHTHDAERRRMEEYRKVCKREGVTSARLDAYDRQRDAANVNLDDSLAAIDDDQTIRNADKKRRKFALKRRAARMTLGDLSKAEFSNQRDGANGGNLVDSEAPVRDETATKNNSNYNDNNRRSIASKNTIGYDSDRTSPRTFAPRPPTPNNPIARAVAAADKRRVEDARARDERAERMRRARRERSTNNKLLTQSTRKGQPLMSGKVEFILNQIKKKGL